LSDQERLKRQARITLTKRVSLLTSLFPSQLAAIKDPTPQKCIWTTRRAGKTHTVLVDFLFDGMCKAMSRYAFIALTRNSAEDIAWPILKEINRKHNLKCHFQEAKLRCTLPNGSTIKLYGADRDKFLDRLYGQKFRKIAIDEAAFYSINIETMVYDHLLPCLAGEGGEIGQIYLMSIPGVTPFGMFFNIVRDLPTDKLLQGVEGGIKGWSVHRWTTADNPYARDAFFALLKIEMERNPDYRNDPKVKRNYFGEYSLDYGEQVYLFTEDNYVDEFKHDKHSRYVLGVDFGWTDRQSFSVVGWNKFDDVLYEIESYSESNMRMDVVASYIRHYMEAYPGIEIVGDPANKQYVEEVRRRYSLPIMAAEKTDKYEWIEIMNSDLSAKRIMVLREGNEHHVDEMATLTWKYLPTGERLVQPGLKEDACDAFLYAYRHAYHYMKSTRTTKPKIGSQEFYRKMEEKFLREAIEGNEHG
jgi:hypothetical protein